MGLDAEDEDDAASSALESDSDRDAATMMGGGDSNADVKSPDRLRNRLIVNHRRRTRRTQSIQTTSGLERSWCGTASRCVERQLDRSTRRLPVNGTISVHAVTRLCGKPEVDRLRGRRVQPSSNHLQSTSFLRRLSAIGRLRSDLFCDGARDDQPVRLLRGDKRTSPRSASRRLLDSVNRKCGVFEVGASTVAGR